LGFGGGERLIPYGWRTEHQYLPLAIHTPRAQPREEALPQQQRAGNLTNAGWDIRDMAMANGKTTERQSHAVDGRPVCQGIGGTREKIIRVLDGPSPKQRQGNIRRDTDVGRTSVQDERQCQDPINQHRQGIDAACAF
jgi:hypothetical protein